MKNLTDLEICKRIAEIEGFDFSVNGDHVFYKCNGWPCAYNPLVDDALCFQLMVKYKLSLIAPEDEQLDWDCVIRDVLTVDKSPNRAICLAIIEANKE